MVTECLFIALVAAVALQRGAELIHSRRNVSWMLAQGGREHAPHQMKWMVLLHAGWLVGMVVEVLVARRPFIWQLALVALVVFGAGQVLRYIAITTLGRRWSTRIITIPGERAIGRGIFRYMHHPNYFGVVLEMAALPLVHGAWITAFVASALNVLLLTARIAAEEAALTADSRYREVL